MQTNTKPWVWLVDDDCDDQLLVRAAFGQASPNVTIYTLDDGDQLIQALTDAPTMPRLVLLDLNMARMGGFETLQAVRTTFPDAQLPIIILSTSANKTDHNRAMEGGANAFISKPSEYTQLVELTKELSKRWLS